MGLCVICFIVFIVKEVSLYKSSGLFSCKISWVVLKIKYLSVYVEVLLVFSCVMLVMNC